METRSEEDWQRVTAKYCPRCILRHTTSDLMQNVICESENDIIGHLTSLYDFDFRDYISKKLEKDFVCSACLGLLQDSFLRTCVDKVVLALEDDCYDFPSFQLLYTLPVQLMLLDALAGNDFKQLSKDLDDEPKDVKQIMKTILDPMLAKQLDRPRIVEGLLEISIMFSHTASAGKIFPLVETAVPLSYKERKEHERKRRRHDDKSVPITQSRMSKFIAKLDEITEQKLSSTTPKETCQIHVSMFHLPVFVGGRYNKYSRTLPQSPWLVEGERKVKNSVQEYIADPVLERFKADKYNFASSGREDVDVKMLGNGRPFSVELINPRFSIIPSNDMEQLQRLINDRTADVQINSLQIVDKERCKQLNEAASAKTKSYSALCCFRSTPSDQTRSRLHSLSMLKDVKILQRTPVRVLHRRPLAVRPRLIHTLSAVPHPSNPLLFKLSLSTQAGTYVKEFVHGDFGRTVPNLSSPNLLGAEVDIISLDVESVNVAWP